MKNIIAYLKYNYNNFSETEKIIADYFINATPKSSLKIQDVADILFLSPSTISRFAKAVGFQNYKELVYEMSSSFEDDYEEHLETNRVVKNMWEIHGSYFKELYTNMSSLDINFIANKIQNSKGTYFYGFGKTNELLDPITFRLEDKVNNSRVIPHFEHLMYTLENVLTYENLLIVLYEHEQYKKSLDEVILVAKKKFIPIVVISLTQTINERKFASSYILYPQGNIVTTQYATTYYMPFLIFFDIVYYMIGNKKHNYNTNFF